MEPESIKPKTLKERWNNLSQRSKKIIKILLAVFSIYLLINLFSSNDKSQDSKVNQISNNDKWANYDSGKSNNLKLDVDAIQEALKNAKGPQDFEKKVNEIYTGNEIISINVQDKGNENQVIYLYIDKDPQNGQMEEKERILSLDRILNKNSNQVQIQTQGYGPYQGYSYTSPLVYGLVSGLTNYWIISSLMYNTPMSRYDDIRRSRENYRKTDAYKNKTQNTNKSKANTANKWGSKSGNKGSWNRGTASSSNQARGSRGFFSSNRSSRGFFSK